MLQFFCDILRAVLSRNQLIVSFRSISWRVFLAWVFKNSHFVFSFDSIVYCSWLYKLDLYLPRWLAYIEIAVWSTILNLIMGLALASWRVLIWLVFLDCVPWIILVVSLVLRVRCFSGGCRQSHRETISRWLRLCYFDRSIIFMRARWRFIMYIGNENNEFNQHFKLSWNTAWGLVSQSANLIYIARLWDPRGIGTKERCYSGLRTACGLYRI